MTAVDQILGRMRRVLVGERCARGAAVVLAVAGDLALGCLVLHRVAGVSPGSLVAVGVAAALAMTVVVWRARASLPNGRDLARVADRRAGTRDLFASAWEFARAPERYGWLGGLTCDLARRRAAAVALRPRWSPGPVRRWVAIGSVGGALLGVYIGLVVAGGGQSVAPPDKEVAVVTPGRAEAPVRPATAPRSVEPAREAVAPGAKEPEAGPAAEPAVKITNEMIDKYLAQMPAQQEVDLTGVTPVRWDADEANGKDNPQNQPPPDKIDPVKLDAALLKDLQDARKKKDEGGGKEGGVDVAVMGDQGQTKAKGKEGGKSAGESLANAVSKDPRGEPTRMAARPAKKGMQVRSAARAPSRQKGEERPMGLLDFLAALEQAKGQPADVTAEGATPQGKPADHVVRQEALGDDAAALSESYFGQLRKADR